MLGLICTWISQNPSATKSNNTVNLTLVINKAAEAAKGALSTVSGFGQGVLTAVIKDVTYNTQVYGPINQNQQAAFYLGETVGHAAMTAAGTMATLSVAKGTVAAGITLAATGGGALAIPVVIMAGTALATYTAGVTVTAAQNSSASMNQYIQSSKNGGSGSGSNGVDANNLPEGWTKTENNGFTHIRDADGNIRVRIDPPDAVTNYPHQHVYDASGNSLDINGNIVSPKSPDAHIPLN